MSAARSVRFIHALFIVCVGSLALGQFSSIYRFDQGSIYIFDLFIVLYGLFSIIHLLKSNSPRVYPLPFVLFLTFAGLGAVSLLFSPLHTDSRELLTSASYLMRFLSYLLFIFVTWNFLYDGTLSPRTLTTILIYSGVLLFILGCLQLAVFPDLAQLDPLLGWDPHKNRMTSTFFDPNFLGAYFVICLALSLKLKKSHVFPVIFLAGILLTFSRSAWLSTAILIFFSGLKNRAMLTASLCILLLAVFAVPRVQTRLAGITDPQDSASFRLISWQNTAEIIRDNWVFGTGYNSFRYAQRDHGFLDDVNLNVRSGAGSDSSLLLVWATSGILGAFFYLGAYLFIMYTLIRKGEVVLTGLVIGLVAGSFFINSLFYPQIFIALFTAIMAWWPLKGSNL